MCKIVIFLSFAVFLPALFILADMTNYYTLLELEDLASIDEIKAAHRKLSKRYHPDLNNGDKYYEEKFKEIQHGYEQLCDPLTKENLDSYLRWQHNRHNESTAGACEHTNAAQAPFGPYPGERERWWQKYRVPTLATIVISISWSIYNTNKEQPFRRYNNYTPTHIMLIKPADTTSMFEPSARSVRKGATKREILNTAGKPGEILMDNGDEIWTYGSSTVTFRNDTVVGYADMAGQFKIRQ